MLCWRMKAVLLATIFKCWKYRRGDKREWLRLPAFMHIWIKIETIVGKVGLGNTAGDKLEQQSLWKDNGHLLNKELLVVMVESSVDVVTDINSCMYTGMSPPPLLMHYTCFLRIKHPPMDLHRSWIKYYV